MNLRELLYNSKIAQSFQTVDEETVVVPNSYLESKKLTEPAGQQRAITFREEFKTSFKDAIAGYIEVFKNPTKKEMNEIDKDFFAANYKKKPFLRYFADNRNKTFYVFSGRIPHLSVAHELNFSTKDHYSGGYLIGGQAVWEKNKWVTRAIHNIEGSDEEAKKKFTSIDWSWVDKYISSKKEISRIKKDFRRV